MTTAEPQVAVSAPAVELPATMRMAVMDRPGQIELREVPTPQPGPGEVLLQVKATAICTWEQRTYTGQQGGRFPFVGGHETSGVVVARGPGARQDLQPGEHVALGPAACGVCHYCLSGRARWCPQHYAMAVEWEGAWGPMGFAEYRPTLDRGLYKLDPRLPFSHGALSEPLACAVRASEHGGIRLADEVVVVGAGPMGLLNVLVARRRGARVMVVDRVRQRVEKALSLGADEGVVAGEEDPVERVRELTQGRGARVVILAVGSGEVNRMGQAMLEPGGRLILFAGAHPPEDLVLDPNELHERELGLLGSVSKSPQDFYTATRLLSLGLVEVGPLIETTLPLGAIQEAMELAIRPDSYRVVVVP